MENVFQTVVMPNGAVLPFDDCIDNLQHTRNYSLYLDTLLALSKNYLIVASVNDNYGRNIPDDILEKLHKLGFSKLEKNASQRYICIIDRGEVYCEISEESPSKNAFFEGEIESVYLSIASNVRTTDEDTKVKMYAAWYFLRNEAKSEIIIGGNEYSLNCSGLNIAVCDVCTHIVLDSSNYDFALSKQTFFHKNLDFNEEYFDTHFFVHKKDNDFWRRIYRKSYYSNEKLGVTEIENGIFLPTKWVNGKYRGGVCNKDGGFVYGCQKFIHTNDFGITKHITSAYSVPEDDLDYIDEVVIFGGWLYDHPGHLIIEGVSYTLWYAVLNADPNIKIAVRINKTNPKEHWGTTPKTDYLFSMQFFSAMGISKERIILVEKPTRFKKIIVPDQGFLLNDSILDIYSFTDRYVLPYKTIRERTNPTGYSKVYFTKRKARESNFLGEDYFIDFFRKKGFKIIDPEDYSISEKAGILRDADEFVTMNGTSQHFAVFCKPSVKMVILQRDNASAIPVQTLMTESVGIKGIYIVNISLDFIHQSLANNVNLIGVTDEWISYVKQAYGEDVGMTKEEYIKTHMYDYLCFYPKYYFKRQDIFDGIKNFKALDMLKNISEVLLGEELDTNGLELTTREDQISEDVNFLCKLLHDMLFENKLKTYLYDKQISSVSLLCGSENVFAIFKDIFTKLNIKINCLCDVAKCEQVSEHEWELCQKSDAILGYNPINPQFGERDGIQVVDICTIIS